MFVTHDLDEAVRLADQVVVMRSGKIVQQSSPETLLERPSPGFVQEFVGGDRVLKRLSRFLVGDHMQPGEFRPAAGESRPYVTPHVDHPFTPVWRIDDTERLVGLSIPGSDSLLRPPEPFWVDPEATLREALSLMLYLHVDRLPVAARDRRPAGVVTLARVHAVARRSVGHHE